MSFQSKLNMVSRFVSSCEKCTHGNKVTVEFSDGSWTFHAQWLYDARCDDGPTRNALTAFCEREATIQADHVRLTGQSKVSELEVKWNDGSSSKSPLAWLKIMAPLVAQPQGMKTTQTVCRQFGWCVDKLRIPHIAYNDIIADHKGKEAQDETRLRVLSLLLQDSSAGIIKITGLPEPDMKKELDHDSVLTKILLQLYGEVWKHPKRDPNTTFNVASHNDDQKRANDLPNYDIKQTLLPHSDHAFYDNPIQVMGFYCPEGKSENTWVSSHAALKTTKEEAPDLYPYLCNAPMALGRVSRFYGGPLYQATVDTPVTLEPGSKDTIKRLRWHPNLSSSLLAPYEDFQKARLAHVKMQEIIRRDSHQYKIAFEPGDLYIWNNFRLLHGRERVLDAFGRRTGIGQTVTEAAVADRYRELLTEKAKKLLDEKWLVHMPAPQLEEAVKLAA